MRRFVAILALVGCSALESVPSPEAPVAPQPCPGDLVPCESEYEIAFVRAMGCDGNSLSCEARTAQTSCLPKQACRRRMQRNRTKS